LELWSPDAIIAETEGLVDAANLGSSSLTQIHRTSCHNGPVKGLHFNPLSPQLLASGASDGEVGSSSLGYPSTLGLVNETPAHKSNQLITDYDLGHE
jgi:hypothetical protein